MSNYSRTQPMVWRKQAVPKLIPDRFKAQHNKIFVSTRCIIQLQKSSFLMTIADLWWNRSVEQQTLNFVGLRSICNLLYKSSYFFDEFNLFVFRNNWKTSEYRQPSPEQTYTKRSSYGSKARSSSVDLEPKRKRSKVEVRPRESPENDPPVSSG